MNSVEFQTNVKDGIITIPEPFKAEFMSQSTVRVIIVRQTQSSNLLQYLLDHPLKIDSFVPLQRDEIYDR